MDDISVHNKRSGLEFKVPKSKELDAWWDEFGSPDMRNVYENFGMEVFRRSSCLDGFNKFISDNNLKGKCCVEIGTLTGLTAVILSRYFKQVISIDVVDNPLRHQVIEFLKVKNVEFVVVGDNDHKAKVINDLKFDMAYCDGDHSHDAHKDYQMVKRGGRILFHEYWPLQPPVWNLVNKLKTTGTVISRGTMALWIAS